MCIKNEVMDLCKGCPAPCCFNKIVPLSEEDLKDEVLLKNSATLFGTRVLKTKENNACIFLDVEKGLCSAWNNRPYACKQFSCLEQGF